MSQSKDLFFLLLDKLRESKVPVTEEIGGHSSVWAIRAQHENCKVYVVPDSQDYLIDALRRKDLYNGDNLQLPLQHMEKSATATRKSKLDTHLVFEYLAGDEILGVVAPRSNRFYFVHDPNGSILKQLEPYHDILEKVD